METARRTAVQARSTAAAREQSTAAVIIVGSGQFRREVARDPAFEGRIVVALSPHEVVARDTTTAGHDLVIQEAALAHLEQHAPDKLPAARSVTVHPQDPIGTPDGPSPLSPAAKVFKRGVDLVLGGIVLVIVLPALLVLCVAIKLTSAGPALFVQERVGENGRLFRVLKLRSMYADSDEHEHLAYAASLIRGEAQPIDGVFKLRHDPRITPLGRWLRKLSLDELPQLWNVVRGEMSLIGPRPALPNEVALYGDRAQQRLRVKPGMTGLWQVSGRSALSFDQMVDLDLLYWLDWSLRRELWIFIRTPLVVFSGRGAA